jgi:alpha-galactosidase
LKKRIVLIGAGSSQFGFGTMGDIFQSQVLQDSEIVLHDINEAALSRVAEAGGQFIQENNLPYTISATTSRQEALRDADFCIISIEVGNRFDLWEQDWRIPQQFGIRQVYGENGGPGGLFHSLRIVPPILEICADISAICPKAWVFNYSNPMSRICTTVCRKFPDLNFVGLCHEIASLKHHLPNILGLPWESLSTRAAGLNHFSVLISARHAETGEDLYPAIMEKGPAYLERLPSLPVLRQFFEDKGRLPDPNRDSKLFQAHAIWPERSIFRIMMDRMGVFPITTDSHFGEYIQWAHDAADHRGIIDFYNLYKNYLSKQEPSIKLSLSERVIPIMEGIITDSGYEESAVNVPNKGYIPDLPEWLVVEVPARVDKDGVHGLDPGPYPKAFLGLLHNQVAVHDLTAEAALTGSRAAVVAALMVDPVVDVYQPLEQLVDTMLELQQDHLAYIE